ncbi:alpha-(1,3)-fucosyltransferase 6 [Lingula anatina]|uniref:Fucosyltransferase n=1 Tax=Lingula anatina TaxID=7574 RepID=A0A1S3K4A5_LINAN|nr:alpha-(1,3)-fucosyltransferase 6 [Lingula anatina]XP_013417460.1 alpha-(1,3)-fucosyltransferase 6 [Lingula anatina]|eukprot:XP_013417458.1 alpha-(1,3)-fucosyltransferase 6 [Lingula anatina]
MVSMLRFYKVQLRNILRCQNTCLLLGWCVVVILGLVIGPFIIGNSETKLEERTLFETGRGVEPADQTDLCANGKCSGDMLDNETVLKMLNAARQPLETRLGYPTQPIQTNNLPAGPVKAIPAEPVKLQLPKDNYEHLIEPMKRVFCSTLYQNSGIRTNEAAVPDRPNGEKLVLVWNFKCWHNMNDLDVPVTFTQCPVKNCIVTEDKRLSGASDAIIFNSAAIIRFLSNNKKSAQYLQSTLPSLTQRPPGQRWVFHNRESPCQTYFPSTEYGKQFLGSFNWTMTYRVDSDIYNPYGLIIKATEDAARRDYIAIAKSKPKQVAWVVSHCNTASKREHYVTELSKYISVDIYGACGEPCPPKDSPSRSCFEFINATYKFYLAFENSFSTDYVTEKFYQNAGYDLVIINRGAANYTRLGIKPEWHINTADFPSPKALADYLLMLDSDVEKYASYLSWKAYQTSVVTLQPINWCDMCRKLNDPTEPVRSYSFTEIAEWFYGSSEKIVDCKDASMNDFMST